MVNGSRGPDGKRRQVKRLFDSLEKARNWDAEVRHGVAAATSVAGGYSDASRLIARLVCERWLARRAEEVGMRGGFLEVTINGYASALQAPLHIGDDRIAREVTAGHVESMLRLLATAAANCGRRLSHRSIVYSLGALR